MTLRELCWAAGARREFEGELVAHLIRCVPLCIWDVRELEKVKLNPFRTAPVESEALRDHKAKLNAMRMAAAAEANSSRSAGKG